MIVKKCDICKKIIEKEDVIRLVFQSDMFKSFEFCLKCAKPLIRFLKNNKLIKTHEK